MNWIFTHHKQIFLANFPLLNKKSLKSMLFLASKFPKINNRVYTIIRILRVGPKNKRAQNGLKLKTQNTNQPS